MLYKLQNNILFKKDNIYYLVIKMEKLCNNLTKLKINEQFINDLVVNDLVVNDLIIKIQSQVRRYLSLKKNIYIIFKKLQQQFNSVIN